MIDTLTLIEKTYNYARDVVSPGYDKVFNYICKKLMPGFTIHEYKTGTPCWSWKIPESWECHKASVKDQRGHVLFSTKQHPLRVMRYSKAINGWFTFSELRDHLYYDKERSTTIPFIEKPYPPYDWGICITYNEYIELDIHEKYYVRIDSEYSDGKLKVGEYLLKGESEEEYVFVAHLDGAYQADYGLSGVVTLLSMIEYLLLKKRRHFTYRFLILPHIIGSIAYLSHNPDVIENTIGAIELDFIGNTQYMKAQSTKYGDWEIDEIISEMKKSDTVIESIFDFGNTSNSREFNFVGESYVFNSLDIPMISLFRLPYKEAFTHEDSYDMVSEISMEETYEKMLEFLDIFETNKAVKKLYEGPFYLDPKYFPPDIFPPCFNLYKFSAFCDTFSIVDIAKKIDMDYDSTLEIISMFERAKLLETRWNYSRPDKKEEE